MIDHKDIDGYAAEYVLGTLDLDERDEINVLRASDPVLDAAITCWENRLAPLNDAILDVLPTAGLFFKIEKRIKAQNVPSTHLPQPRLKQEIRRWQMLALAASLAFIVVTATLIRGVFSPEIAPQVVAILQKDPATPLFVLSLNEKTATVAVRTVTAPPPNGKSYELWLIKDGETAPRPLGILKDKERTSVALSGIDPASIHNATFAVSVEPLGGSPTGVPTGPVIVTGKFAEAIL